MNLNNNFIRLIFATLTVFAFVTSCQKDEFDLYPFAKSEFIEIQGDLDNISVLMNIENRAKYQVAVDRILSLSSQNGSRISFKAQSGADVNISEQLYYRITKNTTKLIESGNFFLIEENGKNVLVRKKQIGNGIVRLKSTTVEGDGNTKISLDSDANLPQAVLDGFKSYDSQTTSSMTDIWDMDSRDWGTASQNAINTSFTINGYSGNVYVNNGCYNSNNSYNGSNDCSGNNICEGYKEWDSQAQRGMFVLNDCQGLPLAVVQMSGYDAYQYMGNYLGW